MSNYIEVPSDQEIVMVSVGDVTMVSIEYEVFLKSAACVSGGKSSWKKLGGIYLGNKASLTR